jgi:hypothetical protein
MLLDIFYGIIENIYKNCPNQFKLYDNKYLIKYEFNQISSLHGWYKECRVQFLMLDDQN